MLKVKEIYVNDYLSKSNLPASDFVINPYVGCSHGCKYCYACFMKRFTNHNEPWGTFVDVKLCNKKINLQKIENKEVFMSSVTDCYNEVEKDYKITKLILEQLVNSNCKLTISTKSKLILRDINLLKKIKNLTVCVSVNTTNEKFRADMDNGSSIKERFETLKELHNNGIKTVLFMSPMFPYITEWKEIINETKDYINEYWFENLNLRGDYKIEILNYIKKNYSSLFKNCIDIYKNNNNTYWEELAVEIDDYCTMLGVNYKNYFYHTKLVEEKKNKQLSFLEDK